VLAVGLANWHATHRHCPRCGAPTVVEQAGFVRRCPADGSEHSPRTDPAIIVLVTDASGDLALLGSSGRWGPGRFSTLAGFVEPGEAAEGAVVREVLEESGVAIGEVTYLGSQPWPFPSSLMLGFTARALDPDAVPQGDGVEIVEARWFSRAQVLAGIADGSLGLPPAVSIARRLIEHWFGAELPEPPRPNW
jgi:NAD+ diphosphatase